MSSRIALAVIGSLLSVSAFADGYACKRAAKIAAAFVRSQEIHYSTACEADIAESRRENLEYEVGVFCAGSGGFTSYRVNTRPLGSGGVVACDVLSVQRSQGQSGSLGRPSHR